MRSFPHKRIHFCSMLVLAMGSAKGQSDEPPYASTAYVDSNIVSPHDRTAFAGTTYSGTDVYNGWDVRTHEWADLNVYAYHVAWSDLPSCIAMVDTTFVGKDSAGVLVEFYARALGRIPLTLRAAVKGFCIMAGDSVFSTNYDSIVNIYHGQGLILVADGVLEETLIHEGTHAALDPKYAAIPQWLAAQKADVRFISDYAAEHPTTEDMAESVLFWIAMKFVPWRITDEETETVHTTIPHRLKFLDDVIFDEHPMNWDELEGPTERVMGAGIAPVTGQTEVGARTAPMRIPCGGRIGPPPPR